MSAVEALHVALQQSFSPDASVRDPAEAAIKNLKNVPGATQMLLHITEEKQVSEDGCRCGELDGLITVTKSECMYIHMMCLSPIHSCFTTYLNYSCRFNMKFAKQQPFS